MKKIILSVLLFVFIQVGLHAQCNFSAPTVNSVEVCQHVSIPDIIASTTETVDEWKWYQADGVTPIVNNSASFASGVNSAVAGTTTFYVSFLATDAVSLLQCESAKAAVTVKINALPVVSIDETKTVLCYDQGAELIENTTTSTNGAGTATWTVDGSPVGITSGGIFDPTFKGMVTGTYVLGFIYTDAKGCVKATTKSIDVQYSPAPTTTGHLSLITQNIDAEVTAAGLPTATFKWYAFLTGGTSIGTGSPWLTGDQGNVEIAYPGKNYYASQTLRGCESPRTAANVIMTNCPFIAPTVVGVEKCIGTPLPNITAAKPVSMTEPVDEWRWYTVPVGGTATNTATGSYAPGISNAVAGTYTLYVSYVATEYISGVPCESPKTAVSVIVNPLPTVSIDAPIIVYQNQGDVQINSQVNFYSNGIGTGIWTIDGSTASISSSGIYTPTTIGQALEVHTIEYLYTDGKGCSNIATYEITTGCTAPPTIISPITYCLNSPSTSLTASGSNLLWYTSEFGGIGSSTPPLISTNTEGTFSYWVSQTINGCESQRVEIKAIVSSTFQTTITANPGFNVCEGTAININTTGGTTLSSYIWTGSGITQLENTAIATPTFSASAQSGTYNITVNVTDEYGCMGTATQTITINPYPTIIIGNNVTICSGNTLNLTATATPASGVIYSWTGPQNFVSSIQNPSIATTTSGMNGEYIVTANFNGCLSSDTTSVTIKPTPNISISNNISLCIGSTIQISSTTVVGATYNWNGPNGFISTIQNPTIPNATSAMSGTYQATATLDGCTSPIKSTTITVSPRPTITASSNSPVCQGSTLNLISTPSTTIGATYAWTGPGGYTVVTQNPFHTGVQSSMSGTYTVYVTVAGCTSDPASTTVTVNSTPMPIVTPKSYCINSSAAQLTAIGTDLKWYPSVTGGIASSTAPIPITTAAGSYSYWVSQTINGCESPRAQLIVTINSFLTPIISGNPGFSVCQGNAINLQVTAGSPLSMITWSGTASAQLSGQTTIPNPTFSAIAPAGTYILTVNVSDANGCAGTASQTISVKFKPSKLGDKDISSQIAQTTEIIVTDVYAPNIAKWYADESLTTLVNTGSNLQISDAVIQQKYYYVTQRTTDGCESAPALYTICSTSIPQVNFSSITIQLPEALPTINLTNTLGANEVVSWIYNEDTINGSLSYTPNTPLAGDYELFLEIKNTQTGCVSDEFIIPITVNACLPLPILISDTSFNMYLHETPPTFEVQEPNTSWFDANYNQIGTGNSFTPLISRTGTFTFYAQQTNGTCVSKYKPFIVTVQSYSISGKVFFDRNEDGICQTTDVTVPNQMLYINETQEYVSTNSKGEYVWNTVVTGIYTISMVNKVSGVQVLGSDVATLVIDAQHSIISNINFRYKVNPINDIYTYISYSVPVVGRPFTTYLYIKNNGQKQYNVSVKATFDNTKCTFNSTLPQYLSQAANEIEFMLDSIEANSYKYIYVNLTVLQDWMLTNTTIKLTVDANTTNVDITPSNNKDSVFVFIRNSQDPNDKAVTPSHLDEGYVLMNSKLQYKIRFQNKGTAEAWDIYIKDTLDENLDISTFNVVAASHDVHYTIQGRVVTFYFDNIMLPYEEADELGSNGFVVYDIYPIADLPEQSKVHNTAHIYFDFNPAVVTNTTNSTYVVTLPKEEEIGISDVQEDGIFIAPNPVKSSTTITVAKEGDKQISITDASGKIVMQLSGSQTEFKVDCSSFVSGVYMCTIVCNGIQYIEKIIVE